MARHRDVKNLKNNVVQLYSNDPVARFNKISILLNILLLGAVLALIIKPIV